MLGISEGSAEGSPLDEETERGRLEVPAARQAGIQPQRSDGVLPDPAPTAAQNWCTKRSSTRVRSYSWPDALLVRSS